MTSISTYRTFRTICCHDIFDEPIHASSNNITVFDNKIKIDCICGKIYDVDELEFVGIKRQSMDALILQGIAEIQIPAYLRKQSK